jgi:hypothetical protein
MTWWRHISGLLVGLLLFAGPGVLPALPLGPSPANQDEEDGAGPTELTLALDATVHCRRLTARPARRARSAVIPPHRHHAVLVRAQAAPVSFRSAVNSPLHC